LIGDSVTVTKFLIQSQSMHDTNEIKITGQDANPETIIRQHSRRTHWVEDGRTIGMGSLILTNRRLLFLHRIESSPDVTASIKKLADAPMETVLDHALTLHKNCFQIPLSSIIKVGTGAFPGFPLPHAYLSISYLKGRKLVLQMTAFQFEKYGTGLLFEPQIITDWSWKRAVERAVKEIARLKTR
jgi:hypothetical protein